MKRAVGTGLRILGAAYVAVAFLAMMSGYVTFGMEHGAWEAFRRFQAEWSPFALVNWLIRLVVFAPGLGLYALGMKLRYAGIAGSSETSRSTL